MAKDLESNFEDPALKNAVQRAWGSERAPGELRTRIAQILGSEGTGAGPSLSHPAKPKFDWRRSPLVGLAAAAMIIIGFAVSFQYLRPAPQLAYELPADLAANMVAAHDYAVVDGNLPTLPGVAISDFTQIRKNLKDQLNHPVLVGSLGSDWKLEAAGVAQIGTTDAAQLVFSRGNERVSVFSITLASRPYAPPDGTDYTQVVDGHPISGVVKGGAIHCIVGSKDSKLRPKDVARIRDRVSGLIASLEPAHKLHLAQSPVNRSCCDAASRQLAMRS